jgi:hypothetical protein
MEQSETFSPPSVPPADAYEQLRAAGCRAAVDVNEMGNYPYSLRWPEPTRVKLTIVKRFLP